MNSTFTVKDGWTGSPYDVGVPHYLNPPEETTKKSSTSQDLEIVVEPVLFARRIEGNRVSGVIEKLPIDPYVLQISSELITAKLLAREEKQKIREQERGLSSGVHVPAEKPHQQSSLKRKKPTEKNGAKKPRISEPPAAPSITEPAISAPVAPVPATPPAPLPVAPVLPPPQLPQTPVPMSKLTDTVLLRLSSGQLVRVPRKFIRRVSPGTVPGPTSVSQAPPVVQPVTNLIKVPVSSTSQLSASNLTGGQSTEENCSLLQTLEKLRQNFPQEKEIIINPLNRPNGVLKTPDGFTPINGITSRPIKIRAYQGPAANSQGSTALNNSTLSDQLIKIQQLPVTQHQVFTSTQQLSSFIQTTPVSTATPLTVTRIIQPSTPVHTERRILVLPQSSGVSQLRQAVPNIVTANGAVPSVSQVNSGPVKISILQSPRKADGTPMPPGSQPGILVLNPSQNLGRINISNLFKAYSVQNSVTTVNPANVQSAPAPITVNGDIPRLIVTENGHTS